MLTGRFSKKAIILNLKKAVNMPLTQKQAALCWSYFMVEKMN